MLSANDDGYDGYGGCGGCGGLLMTWQVSLNGCFSA
jgi:hypothetical protein